MTKINRVKKSIIVPLLIINLTIYNFSVPFVLAQDENADGETQEAGVKPGSEAAGNSAGGGNQEIATGDANININAENTANTNLIDSEENNSQAAQETLVLSPVPSPPAAGQENVAAENPTPTPAATPHLSPSPLFVPSPTPSFTPDPSSGPTPTPAAGADIQINNNNEAELGNNIEAEGDSGNNTIDNSNGDSAINTGDVNMVVGLVNTANTNVADSNFSQFLFNIFENSGNDINLSAEIGTENRGICSDPEGCSNILNINNNNQGTIENNLLIDAGSGDNRAISENGNASISTGDVNIVANIFNLLNANVVGSNWYNLIINIFGDWTGDLVLPGKDKMQGFTNSGSGICGSDCSPTSLAPGGVFVNNTSEGRIENDAVLNADTGGNEAFGGSADIRTGDANSQTELVNIENVSLTGTNWFFMAVNNFGRWEGQIFSLPPGFETANDSGNTKIYNVTANDLAAKDTGQNGTEADTDGSSEGSKSFVVNNSNSGTIKNSVVINVSTGGNSASGAGASVKTGNASALLSIFNILNSNITGGNWLSGMINIFGRWDGNLAFGRPDLWIGTSLAGSSSLPMPGDLINYTLTYANRGDADATGVTIESGFDDKYFSVADFGGGVIGDKAGEIKWNIGRIPAGGTGSVSYSVAVNPDIPSGITSSASQAVIGSFETDGNSADNIDKISAEIYKPIVKRRLPSPNLQITKTRSGEGPIYSGGGIDYKIVLVNESDGPAYNVSVNDVLRDQAGEAISFSNWDLGEVFAREKIVIDYTVSIGSEIPAGFYTGESQAKGFDLYGNQKDSPKIFSIIEIKRQEEELIILDEEAAPEISSIPEIPPASTEPAPEVSPVPGDVKAEVKETAEKAIKVAAQTKTVPPKPPEGSIAGSVQEILVSTALAKEENDSPKADGKKEDRAALAEGFLANIKYKDFVDSSGFLIVLLIGLSALPKRMRNRGI